MTTQDNDEETKKKSWLYAPIQTPEPKLATYPLNEFQGVVMGSWQMQMVSVAWKPKPGAYVAQCPFNYNKEPKAPGSYGKANVVMEPGTVFCFLGKVQRIPEFWTFYQILLGEEIFWLCIAERLYVPSIETRWNKQGWMTSTVSGLVAFTTYTIPAPIAV